MFTFKEKSSGYIYVLIFTDFDYNICYHFNINYKHHNITVNLLCLDEHYASVTDVNLLKRNM